MNPDYSLPFITNDRALASALLVKGYRLYACSHENWEKVSFKFHGSKELRESVELYEDDKLFLNAKALLEFYQDCESPSNHQ